MGGMRQPWCGALPAGFGPIVEAHVDDDQLVITVALGECQYSGPVVRVGAFGSTADSLRGAAQGIIGLIVEVRGGHPVPIEAAA
jgi:hypothetical protein